MPVSPVELTLHFSEKIPRLPEPIQSQIEGMERYHVFGIDRELTSQHLGESAQHLFRL
jgi:hypothetical protein